MSVELRPLGSNEQVLQTVAAFNRAAREHPNQTRSILTQTTYWVCNPDAAVFGYSRSERGQMASLVRQQRFEGCAMPRGGSTSQTRSAVWHFAEGTLRLAVPLRRDDDEQGSRTPGAQH
jgi:hypothetical protein